MALEAHQRIIAAHAVAVIRHANQAASAGFYLHFDLGGARVQRVFHQFLHHARRPLHNFAGGDLIRHLFGKELDAVHEVRFIFQRPIIKDVQLTRTSEK